MSNHGDDEEWVKQMRLLEDLDRLEKKSHQMILSEELLQNISRLLSKFAGLKRIPLYRIMEVIQWDNTIVNEFYLLLSKTPIELVPQQIERIECLIPLNLHTLFINVFHTLCPPKLVELLSSVTMESFMFLIQVTRHISKSEQTQMSGIINALSIRELLSALNSCNEPFASKCRLCKAKRLKALELRLINNQVPDHIMKTAGLQIVTIQGLM
jgi:hypothetical protein